MKNMLQKQISKFSIPVFLALVVLQPIFVYGDQGTGSIEINVKYSNQDRADYSSMALKVYQDTNTTPYKEISSLSANPYNIVSLPIGHKYKIEVYANGMYASTDYVDLQSSHEVLDTTIPIPGGVRFSVLYNDGATPIENAIVSVKSQDGKQWSQSTTDDLGQTTRFWIQPPIINDNYYIADVSIGKNLHYSFSPVKLKIGVSQEQKITTPWPSMIHTLLTAKIFKDLNNAVTSADGSFLVSVYDDKGNKIAKSMADSKGQAYFSNLKFGDYVFDAVNSKDNTEWGNSKTTIDGTQSIIQIFKIQTPVKVNGQTSNATENHLPSPELSNTPKNTAPSSIPNCHCMVFRLDNIQDYWLNNVQTRIIDTFQQKNASLTIGIIGNSFGSDTTLTGYIQKTAKSSSLLEIANNGWKFEDFSTFDKNTQSSLIKQSNDKISSSLGIIPSVFIPPYGKINNYTFNAMHENNITFLSANTLTYQTVYSTSDTIHRFPATVATGYVSSGNGTLHRLTNDEIFTNIQNSLHDYGFAVVTLSFQDYAVNNGTITQNEPDPQQIQQLGTLIDKIKTSGIKMTTVSRISNEQISVLIPSWIKNTAGGWANNQVSETDFLSGVQYMVQNHIIVIHNIPKSGESGTKVPSWVKNTAGWWAEDKISDSDFVKGIEFLVQQGIIRS